MSDGIDDFHNAVMAWAERLGLDEAETEEYVTFHMEKGGYKKATTWLPPDPEEGGQGGGFMRKKQQGPRNAPPGGGGQQQRRQPSYFKPGGQ